MKILLTHAVRSPVLAMIRALAKAGHTVIGVDERKMPLGLYSRHARLIHLDAQKDKAGYAGALLSIVRAEKPDILIPYEDVKLISENKRRLEPYTRVMAPDHDALMKAHDKRITMEECRRLGINHPEVYSGEEAMERLNRRGRSGGAERVVVKPSWNAGGGRGFTVVEDPRELKEAIERVTGDYGDAIIQEYIPGGADGMRSVGLLFGNGGRLAVGFTLKKLRLFPRNGGLAALAISTHEEELVKTALPLFEEWKWEGPAEVEYKIDSRDHQPKLLEVNPRFWGTVGFPIRLGVDFPVLACRLARGEDVNAIPIPQYAADIKYLNPTLYLYSTLSEWMSEKGKFRILRSCISELKGKKAGNNVALSDPAVIIGKLLLDFRTLLFGDDPPTGT